MIKLEQLEKINHFAQSLSSESKSGLIKHFGNWRIIYKPWEIAEIGLSRLKFSKHLSHESIREIKELLGKFGFIQNPDDWLGS